MAGTNVYKVYKNRDGNPVALKIDVVDPETDLVTGIDWTDVTRIDLFVMAFDATSKVVGDLVAKANSVDDAAMFDYTTNGKLILTLAALQNLEAEDIPAGSYYFRVSRLDGAVRTEIAHESEGVGVLQFIDTNEIE